MVREMVIKLFDFVFYLWLLEIDVRPHSAMMKILNGPCIIS